jgi:hypothetical protein
MKCPQCGAQTPDDQWNCVVCRMNLYWASQHFDDLAGRRRELGLQDAAEIPPFLMRVHASVLAERTERGLNGDNKVRQIARRAMTEGHRGREHRQ